LLADGGDLKRGLRRVGPSLFAVRSPVALVEQDVAALTDAHRSAEASTAALLPQVGVDIDEHLQAPPHCVLHLYQRFMRPWMMATWPAL
jgi:hypothetical protein